MQSRKHNVMVFSSYEALHVARCGSQASAAVCHDCALPLSPSFTVMVRIFMSWEYSEVHGIYVGNVHTCLLLYLDHLTVCQDLGRQELPISF